MARLDALFAEWRSRQSATPYAPWNGRKGYEIARDILELAGEQRAGLVVVRDALLDEKIIHEIAAVKSERTRICHDPMSVKTLSGKVYRPTVEDVAWATLALPC